MFCKKCGKDIDINSKVCPNCGEETNFLKGIDGSEMPDHLKTFEKEINAAFNGSPVEKVHEDEYEDISSYVKGSNEESGNVWYILRETETPFGFNTMEDIPFTVTGTQDKHQVIVGTDSRKNYYVSALKVDSDDESKKLEEVLQKIKKQVNRSAFLGKEKEVFFFEADDVPEDLRKPLTSKLKELGYSADIKEGARGTVILTIRWKNT